ncbi:hypothetical protein PENTCL1PPCAC_22762 [Pristionchus entomophagus]|uniref:RRM domain-containing protein n=1 Tax=Pristionchus entomophagus TaxID=358040 RepID=A0AAV5U1Y3_9BILA|nr:hypothetical protein PENTCL1PPCAC_22762 [Pristionchus entomophagus]
MAPFPEMGEFFVRCRGLPFSAKESEVTEFLGGNGIKRVQLTNTRDGRPSGEAFVECEDEQSFNAALSKDRQHLGNRYIEVFRCSSSDMNAAANPKEEAMSFGPNYGGVSNDQNIPDSEHVVRLRGLPFHCTKNEIEQFMAGLSLTNDGIIFPHERLGRRSTGEAYVFLDDASSAARALEKNRQNIQHRYIEVFSSTRADLMRALDGNSGGDRDSGSWAGYGGGRGGGYEDSYGYGGPRGAPSGGPIPPHRPTPYDRPTGGYGAGQGGYGGDRAGPYDNGRAYGGGYNDYYGRGYEGGYGYDNGDWGGYEASYDYGARQGGGGGPMRGGRGGGVDNWRVEGHRGPPIGPRMGGGVMGGAGGGGGGKGGLAIKMRGIPFRASEGDIYEFFAPLRPSSIEMVREASGRPSGEARVEFASRQEYDDALLKDKQYMGTRYVELFPDHL